MDSFLPFESSVCEESCPRHEYCPFDSLESTVKEAKFEDLDISTISEEDDLTVQEFGIAFNSILNVGDSQECLPENDPTGDHGKSWNENELENISVDTNVLQDCTRKVLSSPSVLDAKEGLSSMTVYTENCSNQSTSTLVSAMKGSRARQGMPLMKQCVKWAPDVYDPPSTSESHTLKGHRHRPKLIKKDYHKQKNNKSKPSRGSGGDRKHSSRRSSSSLIDPRGLRLLTLNGGIPPVESSGQIKLEVLDYAARPPELKCSSSFYMESLAPIQLSFAEAS